MALSETLNINPDKVPNIKLGLHVAQIILGLTIFILEIIVFRADGSKINGNNGWPFGLVSRRETLVDTMLPKARR
jgi:hypothetical protein